VTVTLVCGPPCAGKTTYVAEHAAADDEVIDYDQIARDLGSPSDHDHPAEMRDQIEAEVLRRIDALTPTSSAWVIRSLPEADRRSVLAAQLDADVVVIDPPLDVLIARAADRPAWTVDAIRQWKRRHSPGSSEQVLSDARSERAREAAMADDDKPNPDDDGAKPKPDDLGDAGKKALEAERRARRDAEAKAKDLEGRLKAIEDKDKSEVERLTEENAKLTQDLNAATAERARIKVALDKGLTATQAKRLVGTTEEELAADADELLADLGAGAKPDDDDKPNASPPGGKPREQLKPGNGDPDQPVEETDVKKLGERMFRH
jgi:5-methylcytosine-specific restriction protein A